MCGMNLGSTIANMSHRSLWNFPYFWGHAANTSKLTPTSMSLPHPSDRSHRDVNENSNVFTQSHINNQLLLLPLVQMIHPEEMTSCLLSNRSFLTFVRVEHRFEKPETLQDYEDVPLGLRDVSSSSRHFQQLLRQIYSFLYTRYFKRLFVFWIYKWMSREQVRATFPECWCHSECFPFKGWIVVLSDVYFSACKQDKMCFPIFLLLKQFDFKHHQNCVHFNNKLLFREQWWQIHCNF